MFFSFFAELREAKVPVSLREYLTLMEAMQKRVAAFDIEDFYFLARTALVKDERHLDRFDRVFGHCFKGIETPADPQTAIPDHWLRKIAERFLTEEEKQLIEALGDFAQPLVWDRRLRIGPGLHPLEAVAEHAVEAVEMPFVLDQRGACQEIETISVKGGDASMHRLHQRQVFAQRDRHLGSTQLGEEREEHDSLTCDLGAIDTA